MRLLWVKAGGLLPLDTGGRIRSYQILKNLAATNSVSLFTFYPEHAEDQHFRLKEIFDEVICCPLALPVLARGLKDCLGYVSNLLNLQPYSISKYSFNANARKLHGLVQSRRYDVLICDFVCAAGNFPWQSPHPKVLFTHNVEGQIWQRHYQVAHSPIRKAVCWREWKTMARAEKAYAQSADFVVTVSEQDRAFFSRYVGMKRIATIPAGVDIEFFTPNFEQEEDNNIVFVGSMDWLPNEDAALFFSEKIFPQVRSQLPNAIFWVVGRHPSPRLTTALGREADFIRVTGTVDDVRPYLHRAAVVVAPLRIGGGTRLKIFEAFACGKPVVSTTIGAEGLPVVSGENILLADQPHAFAAAVIKVCQDGPFRRALGEKARRSVEQHYSWRIVANQFQEILEQVVRLQPSTA